MKIFGVALLSFWLFVVSLASVINLRDIAADMAVIKNTIAQQPQERNICDTIVEYKVFYPAGSLRIGGGVNNGDTALTVYYSK